MKFTSKTPGPIDADIALCAALFVGVPLEDILTGAWPAEGSCPMCGREG